MKPSTSTPVSSASSVEIWISSPYFHEPRVTFPNVASFSARAVPSPTIAAVPCVATVGMSKFSPDDVVRMVALVRRIPEKTSR